MWELVAKAVPSMDAVVKVFCVHTEPNFSLPWQRKRQYSSSSSGFIIGGRRVLTNVHSVEHYTQVKLKKRGSDTKYLATVLAIGTECDIDDGSSLSCCWANAGAAERLLRLHETTQRAFFHSCRSSKKTETKRSRDTVGYHLEKMLKKHHRVIVKNNRVSPDLSTLGFTFIVDSKEIFSCSDERLLRLIMLNASVGSAFSLDAEPKELHAARQPVPNVWITEVGCLNPLNEASNIIHDLSS